jgi:hypothetical protein
MRVLLLNSEDSPFEGPWANESWDLVVDFGWAGTCTYAEWSNVLGCPVHGLYDFGEEIEDVRRIAATLQVGRGRLVDAEGIDWWAMMSPARYPELHEQLLLENLKKQITPGAEVRASRPHRLVPTLAALLGNKIESYSTQSVGRAQRLAKSSRAMRLRQMMGIALDKWDADFGLRRFTAAMPRKAAAADRILLPSSYVNVSRILGAYASALPGRQFLLVTTRISGELSDRPPNLEMAFLASYAPIPRKSATEQEISELIGRWQALAKDLQDRDDWRPAMQRRCYEDFPRWLRVRDAWRRVIEQESIAAVLCGDENNPFNRLPVLLARNENLPTLSCSHGALDMNVLLRGVCADVYLARGEMEQDYLLRRCGVAPERVTIGAPRGLADTPAASNSQKDQIVFFSEAYELYAGRVELFYREVLPRLAAVARAQGKKAIVKLHPFESLPERTTLVNRVLPPELRSVVELTNEPLTNAFLDRTWFGLTVESSVAVDCALRAVPCFLCRWFELGLYGYGPQYAKYGAATILRTPQEMEEIPALLHAGGAPRAVPEGLVGSVSAERLDELFRGKRAPQPASIAK